MVSRALILKYKENEEFKQIVNVKKRPGSIYLSTRASSRQVKKKCCEWHPPTTDTLYLYAMPHHHNT